MVRLRTLGAIDIRDTDGKECRALLSQPKRVALMVFLALGSPRGPHRRDELLAMFWPDLDTEHARNALSQSAHFLRRSLGENAIINHNGDELALAKDVWCDAMAFEDALTAGRAVEALELYRGDLLEGFHVGNAADFERWLGAERSRLADRYVAAAEAVARQREMAGDIEGGLILWKRLVVRDPFSSRIAIRYMRALAASGDRAGALQHARVHETLLRQELNASPDTEVSGLARELQSAAAPASKVAPPNVAQTHITSESASGAGPATSQETGRAGVGAARAPSDVSALSRPRWRSRSSAAIVMILILTSIAIGSAVALKNERAADAPRTIRSLAVLPFEDFSGDSTGQSFAEGMHDALITELARYPELSVISRTSVMRYRPTRKSLPEIARELKVDGVVEGAIVRDAGRLRMSARLVQAASDHEIWAEHYERDLRDVLVLQSELAAAIAGELRVATRPAARASRNVEGPPGVPPRDLYLRELFLRGRHAELNRSLVGVETAQEAYRQAVLEDSTFALGWAGLAGVYGFLADYGYAPFQPTLDSAWMMARRAVALDSMLPEARTALAVTLGDAHDFVGAEREFRRAIELGPSNARAHYWYSVLLVALGRGEEALREAERALALDPFSPRGGLAMKWYATYLLTGEYPNLKVPIEQRRPILKLEPGEPWARSRQAGELAEAGRCKEARSEIIRAREGAPGDNFRMLPWVATVQWWCGQRDSARALLTRMKTLPHARENGYRVAIVHTLFGEKDSAFVWLDRQHWTMAELSGLNADSFLQPLRSDPRYPALLRRLGVRPAS
ncbi:MAG: transcriptional activator protein [Gemmatimonadales bacterium]|nr:transcriptional activator protein [Gemmatimonadales bacterium]